MNSREWNSLDPNMRETIERLQNEAPVRVSAIARALGLTVKASTLPPGISGEIRPDPERGAGHFVIRVSRHDADVRQRFTVAHEIGHFLLHRDQIGTGIIDDALYRSGLSDRREAEANRIAADILMPERLIDAWMDRSRVLGVDDTLGYLRERFEVSDAAMKIRLGLT
jgi:hypothetical protein